MNKQELMNKIKEQCGDCEAWSGTDCTRNPYTQGCLKDEKKPTIEEIVKSIENCKKNGIENTCQYCYTCPASIWDFEEGITECNVDLFQKTIDLIHRLQSENAEQKTEIERLKANEVIECHGMLKGCDMVKQAVKDTAKELIDELNSIKPNVRATYGVQEQVGVDIAINRVKTYFKQKGVEEE